MRSTLEVDALVDDSAGRVVDVVNCTGRVVDVVNCTGRVIEVTGADVVVREVIEIVGD